jgi:hypothetical protein
MMIGNLARFPQPFDQVAHAAWLASLSDDERLIVHMPPGYQFELVFIAYAKRVLEHDPLSVGQRLQLLEFLESRADGFFGPAAVAAIAPASSPFAAIVDEALRPDRDPKQNGMPSFHILTNLEVLSNLLQLNPSLIQAIRLCGHGRQVAEPLAALH